MNQFFGPGDPEHDTAKQLMMQIEELMVGQSSRVFSFVLYDMLRWMIDNIQGDDAEQRQQRQDATLERLFKECNIVVRIGEPADIASVGFVADQECEARRFLSRYG